MNAKAYLNTNRRLEELCNSKQKQIQELRALLTGVKSTMNCGERVQNSAKVYDKTAEIICDIDILEKQLMADIQKLVKVKREISEKLNLLDNAEYSLLLNLRYLNFMTFEAIADEMNLSVRWIMTMHKKSLKYFEKSHGIQKIREVQ